MKYRVRYEQGNGYSCQCCSQYHTVSKTFDNVEEAIAFVHEIIAIDKHDLQNYEDEHDREFLNLEEIGEEIKVKVDDARIEEIRNKRRQELALKKKKQEEEKKIKAEKKERETLETLKKKYKE